MVRGRGERNWNYRVQRARAALTNDNSINYFIQYFLYLKECRQVSGLFQGLCLNTLLSAKTAACTFSKAPTQSLIVPMLNVMNTSMIFI